MLCRRDSGDEVFAKQGRSDYSAYQRMIENQVPILGVQILEFDGAHRQIHASQFCAAVLLVTSSGRVTRYCQQVPNCGVATN
jgi:hypothetical protein